MTLEDVKYTDIEESNNNTLAIPENDSSTLQSMEIANGELSNKLGQRKSSWFGNYFQSVIDTFQRVKDEDHSDVKVPHLTYLEVFTLFLSFGCRAFGGPVAQIAMMKQELVVEQKWISTERFNRVYAVYQVLPGPEATELACYFGYLSRGRIGSLLGGIGFLLPGFLIMLFWSYLYVTYGIKSHIVTSSFRCIRNTIAAMIFRSTYKLAEAALNDEIKQENGTKKKVFNYNRGFLCLFNFLTSIINLNFFISLTVSGFINAIFLITNEKLRYYKDYIGYFIAACTIGFYVLYIELNSYPSGDLIGGNLSIGDSEGTSYAAVCVGIDRWLCNFWR